MYSKVDMLKLRLFYSNTIAGAEKKKKKNTTNKTNLPHKAKPLYNSQCFYRSRGKATPMAVA